MRKSMQVYYVPEKVQEICPADTYARTYYAYLCAFIADAMDPVFNLSIYCYSVSKD